MPRGRKRGLKPSRRLYLRLCRSNTTNLEDSRQGIPYRESTSMSGFLWTVDIRFVRVCHLFSLIRSQCVDGHLVVLISSPLPDETRASCANPLLARAWRVVEHLPGAAHHATRNRRCARHVRQGTNKRLLVFLPEKRVVWRLNTREASFLSTEACPISVVLTDGHNELFWGEPHADKLFL